MLTRTVRGALASLQLQASDADGNTLTYSASGLPLGLQIAGRPFDEAGVLKVRYQYFRQLIPTKEVLAYRNPTWVTRPRLTEHRSIPIRAGDNASTIGSIAASESDR